jgi:hypothetical protein
MTNLLTIRHLRYIHIHCSCPSATSHIVYLDAYPCQAAMHDGRHEGRVYDFDT